MSSRMILHTLWTHEFKAYPFSTKIGNRLSSMLNTWNIITEIRFHVLNTECFVHFIETVILLYFLNYKEFYQ